MGWVEGGMDLWYMMEREGGWNLFFWGFIDAFH